MYHVAMAEKWASFVQTQTQEQKLDENLQTLKKDSLLMSIDRNLRRRSDVSGMYVPMPVSEAVNATICFLSRIRYRSKSYINGIYHRWILSHVAYFYVTTAYKITLSVRYYLMNGTR